MKTASELSKIKPVAVDGLPGIILERFVVAGMEFVVCMKDRPRWWPFGPPLQLVCLRLGDAP
jgi:hypothetical protein